MAKVPVAVLISGRGSNLQSLIEACKADDYPARIAIVISNRPKAQGLEKARAAGIETAVIDHRTFGTGDDGRAGFEAALGECLDAAGVDFICLAGFMRLFTADFVRARRGKIINIHPSLLPAFKGLNVHERMLEQGVKIAGCTVHFVSAEVDAGPIIGQAAVPVLTGDTPETLAARILAEEHMLYPEALRLVADGRARLGAGGIVSLPKPADETGETPSLRNP